MHSVTFFDKPPLFELLPVIKTRHYFSGFKPLMYTKVAAVRKQGLIFDLMKFERDPFVQPGGERDSFFCSDSCAAVSLSFSANGDIITYIFNADNKMAFLQNENADGAVEKNCDDIFSYRGLDEQGWYWGVRFTIPLQRVGAVSSDTFLMPNASIFFNTFVFQNGGETKHFGATLPILSKDIFDRRNLSKFAVSGDR